MHSDEFLVMIIMLSLFALVFGIYYIKSRENMALIERGINPRRQGPVAPRPFGSLKFGLLILGAGVGVLLAFFLDVNLTNSSKSVENSRSIAIEGAYFSLIAIGGGLGLVISYLIEKKSYDKMQNKPQDTDIN